MMVFISVTISIYLLLSAFETLTGIPVEPGYKFGFGIFIGGIVFAVFQITKSQESRK